MGFKSEFRKAVDLFNREEWEEASNTFYELSSESTHQSENLLCETFSKLARIYDKISGLDTYNPDLNSQLENELERIASELEKELPPTVMGISIHNLADRIEETEEDLEMARHPPPIKILQNNQG